MKNKNNRQLVFTHPGLFSSKVSYKIRIFFRDFFIDGATKAFINHNKKVWKGWSSPHSSKAILFDFHNLHQLNIVHFYFLNVLAWKHTAKIVSFGRSESRSARSARALYRSANVSEHLVTRLTPSQDGKCDFILEEIKKNIKNKEDVFNIIVDGIPIGVDIYETYLREFSKPTVVLDQELYAVIRHAISLLIFWQDYIKHHEVSAIVLSHEAYVDCNVLARLAYQRKIPVYTPDYYGTTFATHPHSATSRQKEYKFLFDQLSEAEQKQAVELAKSELKRLYPVKSVDKPKERVLKNSNKLKVLICSHCFYDNPHAYGGMIFMDFYEWLKYVTDIAKKTDYDWYLKTHHNRLAGTIEIINDIIGNPSPITIVPETTGQDQLIQEGIDVVLTVYGTVGREYPLLGVQVVNAGFNPHASFDFTWTPQNFQEYESYLLNLPKLKKNINHEEIYQFYFMHHYYFRNDDLIFDSFLKMVVDLTIPEQRSSRVYTYFLKSWSPAKHENIIKRFSDFIDSNKQYLTMKGPIDKRAPYTKEPGYLT